MNFFMFTAITNENERFLAQFANDFKTLRLPIRLGVYDCRGSFEKRNKLRSFFRGIPNVYFFTANDLFGAMRGGLFHGKSESYLATVFVSLEMQINESELTTLLVRAQDLGAVCPKTILNEFGLGFEKVIPTLMDFGVVYSNELNAGNAIAYPNSVWAISKAKMGSISKISQDDLTENHELYRFFQQNNIQFRVVDNCIFSDSF